MKNVQQFKLTILILFICFSFLNINAQSSSYTTIVNPSDNSTGGVPYNAEVYINGKLATNFTKFGVNFEVITEEFPLKVELKYAGDPLNGVNVGDIIKIINHLLGKTLLDTPIKLLAGDVNDDKKISVSDVQQIRKIILGHWEGFKPERSWIFIDASYNLNMNNWIEVNQVVNFQPGDDLTAYFKAIKIGDVDMNAKPN
jgi:hypothetical protein